MTSSNYTAAFTADIKVLDVMHHPIFKDYGRLLFPVKEELRKEMTLRDVQTERTVEIINNMKERVEAGEQIFYDIYEDAEKLADETKKNTGLFFFRGKPHAKTAIINVDGRFSCKTALHDSFPYAWELSKRGYNAFALISRPNISSARKDLARAIAYIHKHAQELETDISNYSLWGAAVGARIVAWLGSYGTNAFGEAQYPGPSAVIMQYTDFTEVTGHEPPTYACVGANDSLVDYRIMENRIRKIRAQGTNAKIAVYGGLGHGFGLGEGTAAEGWLEEATAFWEENIR